MQSVPEAEVSDHVEVITDRAVESILVMVTLHHHAFVIGSILIFTKERDSKILMKLNCEVIG